MCNKYVVYLSNFSILFKNIVLTCHEDQDETDEEKLFRPLEGFQDDSNDGESNKQSGQRHAN